MNTQSSVVEIIVNKNAGFKFEIEPSSVELFSGWDVRVYNLIGCELVDVYFFRHKEEAIHFAEN